MVKAKVDLDCVESDVQQLMALALHQRNPDTLGNRCISVSGNQSVCKANADLV
jgi:hypothetical protein